MARGDQPPLERHLLEAPQREPREPEVALDVAEHGLHVDGGAVPPYKKTPIAGSILSLSNYRGSLQMLDTE